MANLAYNEIYIQKGDLGIGKWQLFNNKVIKNFSIKKEVDLENCLLTFEVFEHKNDRTISGTGSAAIVGAVIAGPLGAAIGALYGGKRNTESIFYCELIDGKKFVGKAENSTIQTLMLLGKNSNRALDANSGENSVKNISSAEIRQRQKGEESNFILIITLTPIILGLFLVFGIGSSLTVLGRIMAGLFIGIPLALVFIYQFLEYISKKERRKARESRNAANNSLAEKAIETPEERFNSLLRSLESHRNYVKDNSKTISKSRYVDAETLVKMIMNGTITEYNSDRILSIIDWLLAGIDKAYTGKSVKMGENRKKRINDAKLFVENKESSA